MSNALEVKTKAPTVDDLLDAVNYQFDSYVPSKFALLFMNFIKLVNGSEGESHATPPMHLEMLDKMVEGGEYVANLCFRGASKTTVFAEYLFLFIAVFGEIEGIGKIEGAIYVADSMENGAKSLRKNIEFRYQNSAFLQSWIEKATFTDNYLEFKSKSGSRLGVRLFGAKTGLRGTKIFGKRPVLGILDDLVSDEDARSPTVMEAIRHTVYRGVNHALDPTRRKIVMNGTPFNKSDILVEAVESGAWNVNVYPVCERFPCERHEFKGAWEERFSYEYVLAQYEMARDSGQLSSFYQELMLRIATVEDRVLEDHDVRWYPRNLLMKKKNEYNFYITTDFAVSSRATADFTVISVWAHNSNGDWFWVDGICKRQTMDLTVNDLFILVQRYKPLGVGIEISGQQAGFISWVQTEMLTRSMWFNFLSNTGSTVPGIRPIGDKLSRFSLVVPWFKAGKIYFPEELRTSTIMGILMGQLRMVTLSGIKGKDDFLDTISMLAAFTAWKPYDTSEIVHKGEMNDAGRNVWEEPFEPERDSSPLSSYIV